MGVNVHVRYFGMLAEALNLQDEWIDLASVPADRPLKDFFKDRHEKLADFQFVVAVNQEICTIIPPGEAVREIALFPPFAGG